jgi:pimeloyl-ACP methyl ester carboxylesterase
MDLAVESIQHQRIETNGVALHVVTAGPDDGPAVLLLHGFPEFWYGWRMQIPFLAARGFRVIAPDLRGYNLSDKPEGIAAYRIDHLAADAIGLLDALGIERAFLVGHDWGAVIAWWTAQNYPERITKLAVLKGPHGSAYRRYLSGHPIQWLKSWYIFFFQLPWLPEIAMRAWGSSSLRRTSRPDAFTGEDLARYAEAMRQPGAMRCMIHYYRASVRLKPERRAFNKRIAAPTLLIWGRRDAFLHPDLAPASLHYCENGRLEMIDEATHWVQHEEPDRVNALLADFFGG